MTTSHVSTLAAMRLLAVGAAASAGIVLGLAGTASAAPAREAPPKCTVVKKTVNKSVLINKTCSSNVSVLVVKTGPSPRCIKVSAGDKAMWKWLQSWTHVYTRIC